MINYLRTLSARLVTRYRIGPKILQMRAWGWLCGQAETVDEKIACMEKVLEIDPKCEWAIEALRFFRWQQTRAN